jgi:2-hydroxy-3-oxopropionate reductase
MKVGFIGLGIMGKPMAKNLLKAGYEVFAFDIFDSHVKDVGADGAVECNSIQQVAEACRTIITMLPNSPNVKDAVLGDGGIAYFAQKGSLIIDMSSIAPNASKEMASELKKKGIRMIDAPVSGGEGGAIAGTLSIMVGGLEEDFLEAKPLFEVLGNGGNLVGPIGSGNTCKLANQIMVAVNLAGGAEALTLAEMAGADVEKVFNAIKDGFAGSNAMNARGPKMLKDDYKPGFKIDLHWKDLNNVLDTGYLSGSPLPLTMQVQSMFNYLRAGGDGVSDHSALKKYYNKIAGLSDKKD